MLTIQQYIITLILTLICSAAITPFVIKFAKKIGAVDKPNSRKVHSSLMPRIGGLSIVFGVIVGFLFLMPNLLILPETEHLPAIAIGALIIIIVGLIDDRFTISPKFKLIGQLAAAVVVVSSGLKIDKINLPFSGEIELGIFGYVIAILWIIGITNAINLIDGLDGLATGVSVIAISTILVMAIIDQRLMVIALCIILIGSSLGFLFFNFHPAKIFMGDTGALFLGYSISIISMLGLFKSLTLFSLVIPVIILGVPIFDTLFAIIRRVINKQKISAPDRSHLHHRLMEMGFSHRKTVLIIYGISVFFGISAILFSHSTLWGSFVIMGILVILFQIVAEVIGLIGKNHTPLLSALKKLNKVYAKGLK